MSIQAFKQGRSPSSKDEIVKRIAGHDVPRTASPAQALRQYRSEGVGDAKAVAVRMTSIGFTLGDPNDRGMLDVVGFDTTAPAVIADVVRASRLNGSRTPRGQTTRAEAESSARTFN